MQTRGPRRALSCSRLGSGSQSHLHPHHGRRCTSTGIFGRVIDRFGRRRVLLAGAALLVLAGVVLALAGNSGMLSIAAIHAGSNPAGGGAESFSGSPGPQSAQPYRFRTVADIPLTGGTSRFDYQSLDPQAHRLYVAHLGASIVTVVDTQTGTVVGNVAGVRDVHGVLAVPDLGRVYATATGDNQVAVIDPQSLSVVATAPGGDYPDGLAYDPEVGKLYVSDERGGTDTVIDVHTNQPVATIQLGGEAGNTQFDPASHRIYVAVQSRGQLMAIDPTTDQVVGRYDVPGCDYPHGLALNPARRTAFVGCERNDKLAVIDMATMRVVSVYPVGQTPDVLAFDSSLGRLYVAAESGDLTAFVQEDAGVREMARGFAGPNAHSVAVNPSTHHLYLPLEDVGGRPVLREIAVEPQG